MSELVVETRDLRRTFGKDGAVEAVAGVDLRVEAGSIFGFLGPNGAGKTTTLRILATLLPPTSGVARVMGVDVATRARGGPPPDRLRRPERRLRPADVGSRRARDAGPPVRPLDGRLARARRAAARRGGPRRGRRPRDRHLLRRHAPPARRRAGHGPSPGPAVPRRADDRPRPAGASPDVGRGPPPPRDRHQRVHHDPLPRRGRRPVRPPRDHRPRPDRRRGHLGRAQARRRRRRRHDRRRTARPSSSRGSWSSSRSSARPGHADGVVRLYVDDGEASLPLVLRLLDGQGLAPQTLALHRPSLDDVFLRQTGRSLRDEAA